MTDRPDPRGPAMGKEACLPLPELSSNPSRSCKGPGTALCADELQHVMTAVCCCVQLAQPLTGTSWLPHGVLCLLQTDRAAWTA